MSVCLVGDRRSFDRLKMTGATAEQEGAVGGEWVLLPQAMAGESGGETGGRLARGVAPTKEAVYATIDAFDEENDDMDAYINLKEFEVVTLSEVL